MRHLTSINQKAKRIEALYDNDVDHRRHATEIGLDFYRCRCLNDHPGLIEALCDLVVTAMAGA